MKADSSEEDPKEREQLPRSEQQIPSKQSFWNILFPFGRTEQKQLWREDEPLQKQEQIKRQIQEKYLIIDQDHSQRQFSSDTESEGVQKQEQEQESEEVVMLKAKVESLTLALEKCEVQKKLLQIDNKRMREEIQHWLNDPRQVRKYARIQGELSFEFECDEVKMEKRSYLEPKQED